MSFDRDWRRGTSETPSASPQSAPGRQTLAQELPPGAPVQLAAAGGDGPGAGDVHRAASHGISGASASLPHLDLIQHSFGRHDVSHVSAHVGGPAAEATRGMGALAYAVGDHVAFGGSPDLHTAAHEAAHVVQ